MATMAGTVCTVVEDVALTTTCVERQTVTVPMAVVQDIGRQNATKVRITTHINCSF